MRWYVKSASGDRSCNYTERKYATWLLKDWREGFPSQGPYTLVRLTTKRERVIREMEQQLKVKSTNVYEECFWECTKMWLEALKR